MGDISLITWLQASFVLLVVAFMGGAIGWGFGADHAAKSWKKRMATREEAFRRAWRYPLASDDKEESNGK